MPGGGDPSATSHMRPQTPLQLGDVVRVLAGDPLDAPEAPPEVSRASHFS